ncbi:hypothetical protein WG66_004004 [Moniliophthora roreri]|uniref:Uncharacterized protein n=1 Tax=Moniliophthora roreri TaxID=221103 RepID=A0A0W0GCY3_MONRR|nr:hypothetical protein WG66_004004 [Moniliophthora roreri]
MSAFATQAWYRDVEISIQAHWVIDLESDIDPLIQGDLMGSQSPLLQVMVKQGRGWGALIEPLYRQ